MQLIILSDESKKNDNGPWKKKVGNRWVKVVSKVKIIPTLCVKALCARATGGPSLISMYHNKTDSHSIAQHVDP